MTSAIQTPRGYPAFLRDIKARVRTAQVRASLAVNRELILLYWSIGRDILARQKVAGWGAKIIDRLASDLAAEFPGIEGFSSRSLKYMRAFADAWPEEPIVQQLVAQLPWGHHTRLLDRIGREGEPERVSDPFGEEGRDPGGALDEPCRRRSGFGDAEVEGVVERFRCQPVGGDHERHR